MNLKKISEMLPIEFFKNYPFKLYLKNTFPKKGGAKCAFYIAKERVAMLGENNFRRRYITYYNGSIAGLSGSPSIRGISPGRNALKEDILDKENLVRNCHYTFLVDGGEIFYLQSIDTKKYPNVGAIKEALKRSPKELIPNWKKENSYQWEVLDNNLEVLPNDASDNKIIVTGIEIKLLEEYTNWTEEVGAEAVGVIPLPLATLCWWKETFKDEIKKGCFFLYARPGNNLLVYLKDGKVSQIRFRSEGTNAQEVGTNICYAIRDISGDEFEREDETDVFAYVGAEDSGTAEAREITARATENTRENTINRHDINLLKAKANRLEESENVGDPQVDAYVMNWAIESTLRKKENKK